MQSTVEYPINGGLSLLERVVALIIDTVSPDKIILFGSHARGEATEQSDLDILILKRDLKSEKELSDILYSKLFETKHINVPIDFITMDYDRYYRLINETGYVYGTIEREGQILYEAI